MDQGVQENRAETVTPIERFLAPYGREIELQRVTYDNGYELLRLRIREGKRFTILELDAETARHWAGLMQQWAQEQP